MRKRPVLGMTFGLVGWFATVALAQAPAGFNPRELFESLDADRDRAIARDEVPEAGRSAFQRLLGIADTSKDGKLQAEEYRSLLEGLAELQAAVGLPPGRFEALDKDKDGRLSRDEFAAQPGLFRRLDRDGDGVVTRQEAGGTRPAVAGGGMPAARFAMLDANKDGKVSRDEFRGPSARFDQLDADHDGFITRAESERPAARPAGPRAEARFKALDANGDGKIGRDEFDGRPKAFDRLDADHDGSLSRDEFRPGAEPAPTGEKEAGATKGAG